MTFSLSAFLLLAIALSVDTFTAGLSYASQKVKIPFLSVFIISLLSGFAFSLSLSAGKILSILLPLSLMRILSFLILLCLSLHKLYDALPERLHPTRCFTTVHISRTVNREDVHILSPKEAALLSLLLSVDSISAGLGIMSLPFNPYLILVFSTLIHLCALLFGILCGHFLLHRLSCNFSLFGALLLLLLAFLRLL